LLLLLLLGVVLVVVVGQARGWGGWGRRAVVQRLDRLADHVCLADPGALRVRQADRDDMAVGLELADERVDVGRRVRGRRAVVVDHEDMHSDGYVESLRV
jgi:hypothetical protein